MSLASLNPSVQGDGEPWRERAEALAAWTLRRLVNRTDAHGVYRPCGGQATRRGELTVERLVRHFQADDAGGIIGVHAADADNLGKWLAVDIDQHGDDDERADANERAACHWFKALAFGGFHPLLTASNGAGGFHLRVLLASAIDAARLHHFAGQLVSDFRKQGLTDPPEVFPKQPDVRRCAKGLGNWLRLPGRHHKREYWSEVWNGNRWLAGHDAIDHILALSGDDPALIPDVPPPVPRQPAARRRLYAGSDNLSKRISSYMSRLPNGTVGTGRDNTAFSFACFLVRDLALPDGIALDWLARWDCGNSPPKGEHRLRQIIKSAHDYGMAPYGSSVLPACTPRYDSRGRLVLKATTEVF